MTDDGAALAREMEDEAFWGDADNTYIVGQIMDVSSLDAEEFKAFYDELDSDFRGEIRETMEQEDLDEDYPEIYNALKNDESRDAYLAQLEKNFSGGRAVAVSEDDAMATISLWVPKGATPLLEKLITDTSHAMQDSINTLGTGDPNSWMGFSKQLESENISAEGWSNIVKNHEDISAALDKRATDYEDKNKDVDLRKYETDDLRDGLVKKLDGIHNKLNDEHLKIDLEKLFGAFVVDEKYFENNDIDDFSKMDGVPSGRNYIRGSAIKVTGDGENGGAEGVEYENTGQSGILFWRNVENDSAEKEQGYKDNTFYLTPDAEWNFYMRHVENATNEWSEKYDAASEEFQRVSEKVDDDKDDKDDKDGDDRKTYDQGYKDGVEAGRKENSPTTPTTPTPDTPTTPGDQTQDQTQDFSKTFDDLLDKENPDDATGGKDGEDGKDGKDDKKGSALDQVLQPIRDAITGAGAGGTGGATGAAGGGDGGMGIMMPMMIMSMMSQMMQQIMQQKQDEDSERDREERDEEPQSAPAPSPGPAPTAPAAQQPAATAPPAQTDAPPAPTGPETPKSMVDMKLPDGTSQRVSSVVSEAINRELNNPNGSDARAAYQGTPGEASAGSPWVSVESSAVGTGDIAQWENRSGLVVVTDSGLQTIVNGQLVPLDPHNPPDGGQGGYGEFRGFFHPTGADISDPNAAAVGATPPEPPAVNPTAPPQAAAAPPAVTPPATMEVR